MLLLNDTNVTGGATVVDGVVAWLPSCSGTSLSDIDVGRAQNFDFTTSYVTQLLLLVLSLAVVGVCAWGLGESILSTNSTVSDFWSLADQVEAKIANATSDLQQLEGEVAQLSSNVTVLTQRAPLLAAALRRVGTNASIADQVMAALQGLPAALDIIASSVQSGINMLNNTMQQTVTDIRSDWEGTTMSIQDTWRFIPIPVLFGLAILIAAACCLLCWRVRRPGAAKLFTMLLWLDAALLMLLGAGLMRGVYVGSTDSCLYVDTLSLDLAHRKVTDPSDRAKIVRALEYYLGLTHIPDSQVVDQLLGVPTYLLHQAVESSVGRLLLPLLANPALASAARAVGLPAMAATAFQNASTLIPATSTTVARLEIQALKRSIDLLYHDTKTYICCTLSNESYDVWVAWTAAGALCFGLALFCSVRIAGVLRAKRRCQRHAVALAGLGAGGVGPLPAWGPSPLPSAPLPGPAMATEPPDET
ncbi:hypothetical protein ABPG75_010342 [Micractinium tetrahymenae]